MPLEELTADSRPDELNNQWPTGSDPKSQGDDHIRNVKLTLQNFYQDYGVGRLTDGTVATFVNGRLVDAGFSIDGTNYIFQRTLGVNSFFSTTLARNGEDVPVRTPIDIGDAEGSRSFEISKDVVDQIVIQNVDGQIASSPISFPYTFLQNFLLQQVTLRGSGTQIDNVRITLRSQVDNSILFRSFSDEELRTGGGFTISGSGDTVVALDNVLVLWENDEVQFDLERYDSTTDTITGNGITLRGGVISADFVPFLLLDGNNWVKNDMARLSDVPKREVQFDGTDIVVTSTEVTIFSENFEIPVAGDYLFSVSVSVDAPDSGTYNFRLEVDNTVIKTWSMDSDGGAEQPCWNFNYPVESIGPGPLLVEVFSEAQSGADEYTKDMVVVSAEYIT